MTFTDQMGREVSIKHWPPRRIVSLVPSQTEYLSALGMEVEVVGITKFCVRPATWFQSKSRIGGTKTLDYQKIAALRPDLLIGNKEENTQEQIEWLAQRYPVWMSDVHTLDDALEMMREIGNAVGRSDQAQELTLEIAEKFDRFREPAPHRLRAAYLIWRKPYMVAAGKTFVDDMLNRAGYDNVFSNLARYPEITAEQLATAKPEVILLSSEPYPFAEKHLAEIREICPAARVALVDGELFSWYGSRLLAAPAYFEEIGLRLLV